MGGTLSLTLTLTLTLTCRLPWPGCRPSLLALAWGAQGYERAYGIAGCAGRGRGGCFMVGTEGVPVARAAGGTGRPLGAARSRSALEPLRGRLFRALWMAALASSIGSWMLGVTVMWRMAALTDSALLVALVQTVGSLAVVALAVPAGAISDLWPRKTILVFTQAWAAASAVVFAVVAALGLLDPAAILILTFSISLATTLGWPAWQMTLPEVALPAPMPAAVALNSAQWNIAQVLGPLLTGFQQSFNRLCLSLPRSSSQRGIQLSDIPFPTWLTVLSLLDRLGFWRRGERFE